MNRRIILVCMSLLLLLGVQIGCDDAKPKPDDSEKEGEHIHGADALKWPKKDVEHNGYMISLGHHGDHWHGGEKIEPAVAIVKDGKDIGDAKLTCQLMDGETAIDSPVDMIFEPKTEEEPAHFAGAMLTFPKDEKKYQVKFEITLPGSEDSYSDTIEVTCGH